MGFSKFQEIGIYQSFPDYMKLASAMYFSDNNNKGMTIPELYKQLDGGFSKKKIRIALDILTLHAEAEMKMQEAGEQTYTLTEQGKTTLNALIDGMSGMPIMSKQKIYK